MARQKPYFQATRRESPIPVFAPRRRPLGLWLMVGVMGLVVLAVIFITPRLAGGSGPGRDGAAGPAGLAAPGDLDVAAAVVHPTHPADPNATPAPGDGASDPESSSAPDAGPPTGDTSPDETAQATPTSAQPEKLRGYRWPLFHGRITSFFAPRDTGFLVVNGERIHQGLDITTYCGDHVQAAHSGRVVAASRHFGGAIGFIKRPTDFYARVQKQGTLGALPIVVVIDDGNGYRSMYVHLAEALVKVGDDVHAGDDIGLEGMTGNATGCHLHYELVRMDGPWMHIAGAMIKEYAYPAWERERIDPLRVLSLKDKRAARLVPGIDPPRVSPGLGRRTAP